MLVQLDELVLNSARSKTKIGKTRLTFLQGQFGQDEMNPHEVRFNQTLENSIESSK